MNRVTAGLPGLHPQLRQAVEVKEASRAFQEAAFREQLLRNEATFEQDGDSDVTKLTEQMGRPLSADVVIRKLRKLNPHLIFEQAIRYPSLTGIYVPCPKDNGFGQVLVEKRHVCGMPSPPTILPEFSVRHYEWEETMDPDMPRVIGEPAELQPKMVRKFADETRGWRTVILKLVKERLISLAAAEREFEIPAGRSSRYWQALTT